MEDLVVHSEIEKDGQTNENERQRKEKENIKNNEQI